MSGLADALTEWLAAQAATLSALPAAARGLDVEALEKLFAEHGSSLSEWSVDPRAATPQLLAQLQRAHEDMQLSADLLQSLEAISDAPGELVSARPGPDWDPED